MLVTRGYGPGASIALVVLRGYTPGAVALDPTQPYWAVDYFVDGYWADNYWFGLSSGATQVAWSEAAMVDLIINTDASDDEPSNYELCDRTGFRELPHTLQREWTGNYIRAESFERRHPQDFVRSKTDNLPGSVAPEGDDTFVSTLFPNGVDSDSDL